MTAREIGGYFGLERPDRPHYHADAIALNCGRGALMYIAEMRRVRRIWVPDYMCDSVPHAFRRAGAEVLTYRIGWDFLPVYDFKPLVGDWMLLADCFGQLDRAAVDEAFAFSGGRLIVDETQGFFVPAWEGCDTVWSCRKWFGVPDGAYAATSDGARLSRALPVDQSRGRMGFVLGRAERPAGEFFAEASANNELFDGEPVKVMSPVTDSLMRAVDCEGARARRAANWRLLDAALAGVNALSLREPCGPFMYPLLVDDGPALKRRLIERGIFVPILWPNVLDEAPEGSVAHRYARDIVPLPLDQRYGAEEMEYILDTVRSAM